MLISQKISLTAHLSTSERVVGMFLDAIKDHLSYNWSLEVMAKQCGLSRSQFSNYCKDLTNMTPIQYLSHCRHEAALGMLVNHPQMPIQEIALECGFNSSQYFSTTFQNRYGCSPREHRERSMTLGAE